MQSGSLAPKLSTPIEGLVQLWADICHLRGKASVAGQLKPYIARALAEPGSSVHRLVEAAPAQKDFLASYARQPTHLRLRLISEVLSEEVFCQALNIFENGMSCLAMMNKTTGIMVVKCYNMNRGVGLTLSPGVKI